MNDDPALILIPGIQDHSNQQTIISTYEALINLIELASRNSI